MATVQPLTFGALLKRHRRLARLSQAALAERAGFSVSYVSQLERGERTPIPTTVELIADALAIAPTDRETLLATIRGQTHRPTPGGKHDTTIPRLVGRAREIAQLERHVAGDGPPVLLLVGEPGIGKTRLLRESAHLAARAGCAVLSGACHRGSGRELYAPILEALEHRVRGQPLAQLRADLDGCGWLQRLLPELGEMMDAPLSGWTLPPEQERRLMFAAVARFLGNVSGPAGTLLILDDLQWTGADAIDLLASLARSSPDGSLRILGAYRDTAVSSRDPLPGTLLDLVREGVARRAAIEPLAPADAAQLLDTLLAGMAAASTVRDGLLRRTGGIPFYLVNCAQALRAGAPDSEAVRSSDAIPWDVAETIRQRVAAMPRLARDLVAAAAVAGTALPRALLLGAVAGNQDDVAGLEALDTTVRARLMAEDGNDSCHLAHDLVAEVVAADLSAGRRAAFHRRIALALEAAAGEPPAELVADHFARAGDLDRAVVYLERAADRALAVYAYGDAERHDRELITYLDRLGRAAAATAAREHLAAVLMASARYDQAMAVLAEALEALRAAGDDEGMARVAAEVGQAHTLRGTPEEGIAWLRTESRALETRGLSPAALASLYIALATLLNASNQNMAALAAATRGADLARAARANDLLVRAERRRGNALLLLGQIDEAINALDAAIPLAEAVGDLKILWGALNSLGAAYAARGDFGGTAHAYLRAFTMAERLGDPSAISFMWFSRGELAFAIGEWDDARVCFDAAANIIAPVTASRFAPYPPLGKGMLALARGHDDLGVRALTDAISLAERHGDRQAQRWAAAMLAEHDLAQGRASAAHARLATLLDSAAAGERDLMLLLPLLAWAHLERGEIEPAGAAARQAVAGARAGNMAPLLANALRVGSMVEMGQHRWKDAEAALEEALALARDLPAPYTEAKVLYTLGQLHTGIGDTNQARERHRRALAILRPLGERLYAAQIEYALNAST
ncbi:MAG TPA: AAA family ATPase [Ktedonobacterales bacterium]